MKSIRGCKKYRINFGILIFFSLIVYGCQKNHYHLMQEQKQFLSPFTAGTSFKMVKNRIDTIIFNVEKNEITTYSCGKNSIADKGYVKIVNQENKNQIWEISMFADDPYSRVEIQTDTNYIFYNTYELFNDTNINAMEFKQLYKFVSLKKDYQGTLALSPLQGFGFIQCIYLNDTVIYERIP